MSRWASGMILRGHGAGIDDSFRHAREEMGIVSIFTATPNFSQFSGGGRNSTFVFNVLEGIKGHVENRIGVSFCPTWGPPAKIYATYIGS